MIEQLIQELMSYNWMNWLGLITGVVYVALSARNNPLCWVFGIISCASIFYLDVFTEVALYSDALLQFFYVALGVYGLYSWTSKGNSEGLDLAITSKPLLWHIKYIIVWTILSYPFGKIMALLFGGAFPLLDAWTTLLSIWATLLLTRRNLENWIYWIFLNLVYVYLYFVRGVPVISILFVLYTIFSIYGFLNWRKKKLPAVI